MLGLQIARLIMSIPWVYKSKNTEDYVGTQNKFRLPIKILKDAKEVWFSSSLWPATTILFQWSMVLVCQSLWVCPPLFGLFACTGHYKGLNVHSTGRSGESVDGQWSTEMALKIEKRLFWLKFERDDHFSVKTSAYSLFGYLRSPL